MKRFVDPNIIVPRQYYVEVAVSWAPSQTVTRRSILLGR